MISAENLATVDPEIKSLIELLNQVHYIDTLYSCAGFGEQGDKNWINENQHRPLDGIYISSYIYLTFRGKRKQWSQMHKIMSHYASAIEKTFKSTKNVESFIYRFYSESENGLKQNFSNLEYTLRTKIKQKRIKWI